MDNRRHRHGRGRQAAGRCADVPIRLDLRTIAEYRGVFVEPALDGFTERDFENAGLFDALLRTGEQPNRVVVWKYPPMWLVGGIAGKNKTGPIRRFSKHELIVERPARADFVMLPASVITGQIVGQDGKPQASHYVSVTAPDAIRPRGYETITDARSDKKGRFTLTNIPAGAPLNFKATSPGKPRVTSKSATQIFGLAARYGIRIVTDHGGKGRGWLKIERVSPREE